MKRSCSCLSKIRPWFVLKVPREGYTVSSGLASSSQQAQIATESNHSLDLVTHVGDSSWQKG